MRDRGGEEEGEKKREGVGDGTTREEKTTIPFYLFVFVFPL